MVGSARQAGVKKLPCILATRKHCVALCGIILFDYDLENPRKPHPS
jgi:hypothetical protein